MDPLDERDDPGNAAALSDAIDRMWKKFLPEIRARARVLEDAARSAVASDLSETERAAAHAAAHKLAGTLGTFGLARGTKLARELEQMYSGEQASGLASAELLTAKAAEVSAIIENRG